MENEYGLLHAFVIDGNGAKLDIPVTEIPLWKKDQGLLWLHFDYSHPDAEIWFLEESGLDKVIAEALLVDETRPRATKIDDGLLVALRGINHNQGAEPDDMIALRLWIDGDRIITTRRRKLAATNELVTHLEQGYGPKNSGEFLASLTELIVSGMSETISSYEDSVAVYEDAILEGKTENLRYALATLRRQAITIRRYLAPEREAFSRLLIEKVSWLDDAHRIQIREVNDSLIRHIENLDAIRERAAVTQEELLSRLSEELNSRIYLLSLVAAVFLPLGFLTGLLGVNVGGIPGANNDDAFLVFTAILWGVVILQFVIFRWKKWF